MYVYSRYGNIKILELQRKLQSKEDQIFELEATAATATAESTHRAKTAELEAQKRIHQMEEELRRVKIEADQYKGSWLRQRKRVVELESGTKNGDAGSRLNGNEAEAVRRKAFEKLGETVAETDQGDVMEAEGGEKLTTNKTQQLSGAKRRMSHDTEPDTNHKSTADATKLSPSHQSLHRLAYLNARNSTMELVGKKLTHYLLMRDEMGFYSLEEDFIDASLSTIENSSIRDPDPSDENQTNGGGFPKHKQKSSKNSKSSPLTPRNELEIISSSKSQSKIRYHQLRREYLKHEETRSFVISLMHQMDVAIFGYETSEIFMPPPLSDSGLVFNLLVKFNALFQEVLLNENGAVQATDDTKEEERQDDQPSSQPSPRHDGFVVVSSSTEPSGQDEVHPGHSTFASLSWTAALYLLQILSDIMNLSRKCRRDLRLWFYRSRHCLKGLERGRDTVTCMREPLYSSSTGSNKSHPRIEGLPVTPAKARKKGIRGEALGSDNVQLGFDGESTAEWDSATMAQTCNIFFELLVALMKGNVFGREEIIQHNEVGLLELEKTIIQKVQTKAIDLVFRLMSDAVPYHHSEFSQNNATPYLWKFWFDSLFPSYVQPSSAESDATKKGPSGSVGSSAYLSYVDDFFSSWDRKTRFNNKSTLLHYSKLEKPTPIVNIASSKNRSRGNHSLTTASDSYRGYPTAPAQWKSKHDFSSIDTKRYILKLLCLLLSSSSSVHKSTFEVASSATQSATNYKCLAHRVVVAIQIEVNDSILPAMSTVPNNDFEAQKLSHYLQLCHACIQFFFVLCQSNDGINQIRLQIRLSQEGNTSSWSSSSISCMLSILKTALTLGRELEDTKALDINTEIGDILNRIVENSICCFKMMLFFVHHQQYYQQTIKWGNTSLLALISGQRHIFLSICHKILSTGANSLFHFSDEVKCDTRLLLEEVMMDEEDERENMT